MSNEFTVKRAAAQHVEGISKVIRDAIEQVNAKDYPPTEIDRLVQNFSPQNVRELMKQRQTLVALAGGNVVGTGAIEGVDLKSVFVSPGWHRKGIGTALVVELEKIAASQGAEILKVSSSLSAIQFYSALGFIEKSRSFYGDEETVLMSKATDQSAVG